MSTLTKTIAHFELQDLPYPFDALEPHIDAETMEIHHNKHHGGYVKKLNKALEEKGRSHESLEEIMENISQYSTAVRNNGGGHYNHSLFWKVLSPDSGLPSGELENALIEGFGSFDDFKSKFEDSATSQFGSGWAWLIVKDGSLAITSTANQNNPLMDTEPVQGTPILGLDVWEHAYYLKYQNKRAEYAKAFWNVVNWNEVQKRYNIAKE